MATEGHAGRLLVLCGTAGPEEFVWFADLVARVTATLAVLVQIRGYGTARLSPHFPVDNPVERGRYSSG